MTPNVRTASNANAAPVDRAELDRVIAATRARGLGDGNPGFTPQPRQVTPWAHCAVAVVRWAWERVAPFPPRSRLQRRLTRMVCPRGAGRLARRMARLEGMGRL